MLSQQEKSDIKKTVLANQHEIFAISFEEMDAIVRSSPKANKPHVQQAWQQLKSKAEVGASYYASADDLRTLTKLIGDLGSYGAKAYVKTYGGKPHIILKGNPGLRTVLTGTKYGIKNPKVVAMGLGKASAVHAAKQGGIVTLVLLSAYRIADYILTDEATLSQLVGTLATDVVKVGLTTGASIVAAGVAGGFTLAIGPLVAVVLVGVAVSVALTALDEHYGITDQVVAGLDELGNDASVYLEQKKQEVLRATGKVIESSIDYAVESAGRIIVNIAQDYFRRLTSPGVR